MSERDLWELVVETHQDLDRWIEQGRRARAAAGRGDWGTVWAELEARRFLQQQVSARLQRLQQGVDQGITNSAVSSPAGEGVRRLLQDLEAHLRRALEEHRQLQLSLAVRHEALGEQVRVFEQVRRALAAYARHRAPKPSRGRGRDGRDASGVTPFDAR